MWVSNPPISGQVWGAQGCSEQHPRVALESLEISLGGWGYSENPRVWVRSLPKSWRGALWGPQGCG